jgi:hypothetical protein
MKGERPAWFPDWTGQYVAVIGGGPSVKRSDVDLLQGRLRVVVINESWQLAPWADALYSCDEKWWRLRNGCPQFKGLKITQDAIAAKLFPDLKKIRLRQSTPGQYVRHLLMDEFGEVGSGQAGGFQAINWLAQLAVKGIALIGFDACEVDGKIHWHGRHGVELNNPDQSTFVGWKTWLENAAPKLAALDIDVVNCSMVSAVGCFSRYSVAATLERWQL